MSEVTQEQSSSPKRCLGLSVFSSSFFHSWPERVRSAMPITQSSPPLRFTGECAPTRLPAVLPTFKGGGGFWNGRVAAVRSVGGLCWVGGLHLLEAACAASTFVVGHQFGDLMDLHLGPGVAHGNLGRAFCAAFVNARVNSLGDPMGRSLRRRSKTGPCVRVCLGPRFLQPPHGSFLNPYCDLGCVGLPL